MGHTTGQTPNRFHLLGLAKLLFQPPALLVYVPQLGEIAEKPGEQRRPRTWHAGDTQFQRHLAAVFTHAGYLDAFAEDSTIAGRQVVCQAAAVLVSDSRGDDHA